MEQEEEEPTTYQIDYEIFLRIQEFLKTGDIEWCVSMIDEAILSSELANMLLQSGIRAPAKIDFASDLLNHYIVAFTHDKCKELVKDVHSVSEFSSVVLKIYAIFMVFFQEILHKLPEDLIPFIAIEVVKTAMKSVRGIDVIVPPKSVLEIKQYEIDEYIVASQDIRTWFKNIEETAEKFNNYVTRYLKR